MKKILILTAALLALVVLTACSPGDGAQIDATAETPTEVSLESAPTATDEPRAVPTAAPTASDIPNSTPTTEPTPTETAEPTATEEIQPSPQPTIESGIVPEDFQLPEGAIIVFTQTGGFAGLNDTWVFYPDGRVTLNGVVQSQLTPERIDKLIMDLDAQGFFSIVHTTKPGTFCCDFFDYTLAVQAQGRQNFISYSDGNPDLPAKLLEITALMREITEETQVR